MGNVRLYGATSGYTELAPPAVAPDGVLSLPSGTGTLATQDYAAGAGGLVHINTTTFSAVSSVSVDDVFTSDYENYRIMFYATTTSNGGITTRLRTSGTDNSTSNYNYQDLNAYGTTVVGSRATGQTSWGLNQLVSPEYNFFTLDLFNPQTATPTVGSMSYGYRGSSTSLQIAQWLINFNATTQFDGISFAQNSMTGTIRTYGYKNGA